MELGSTPIKTNVYIDGFNLYYGAMKGRGPGFKWLDLDALCQRLLPNDQIHRIRYFTAIVSARPHDPQQPVRQQAYIRAIKPLPHVSVHYGTYVTREATMRLVKPGRRKKTVQVLKTEEKGSDVNLASYLLLDAFKKDCRTAVVISNDADLKAPIAIAQSELRVKVGVVNPHPPYKRSRDLQPTFFKQLRDSAVQASQFPSTLRDGQGKIFKPSSW